ncbi:MAG: acetoacetate--CoA ligase [bacterium]|nr:acetoacetate--CoA ligase [bacterium]
MGSGPPPNVAGGGRNGPLWSPASPEETNLRAFCMALEHAGHGTFADFTELHAFSVADPEAFWSAAWDFCEVIAETRGERIFEPGSGIFDGRFFPDARLNFAENLLRRPDDTPALIFSGESGDRRELSRAELLSDVARIAGALGSGVGIRPGDRVAAWLPNIPETCELMLATAALGGVFSSCSPDFGVDGVVDRFGQIRPRVLVAADGYRYGGKEFDCLERLGEIAARLDGLERIVVVPFLDPSPDLSGLPDAVSWEAFLAEGPSAGAGRLEFLALPFDHPLYVLYSSGTTGVPKSIVHRAGGILLKHLAEHRLQCDVRPGDRVFYFTTAGWMMWNWLMSALASEATLVLYDGAPDPVRLFDLTDAEGITLFGTSAGFVEATAKRGLSPRRTHRLDSLQTITSTGSPLSPEGFEFIYAEVKSDVHLASISGGTDLCGCLVNGDPTAPVYAGEIQRPALGLDIDVFDSEGRPCPPDVQGELVCTNSFPSMPLGFWGDADGSAAASDGGAESPQGALGITAGPRFRRAYFERYPGVWHQGDFAHWTVNGGMVIAGRSDATLNPGGVRIGTAEIYRCLEGIPEVLEAIVIGQPWQADTRIVLFVRLRGELTDELTRRIRECIRTGASPRHVPARVVAVDAVPRTRSGKLTELAVRDVVCGRPVHNTEAIANPEVLEQFRDRPELAS